MSDKTPYLLLILDGFGHGEATESNAIHLAKSPIWDNLWAKRPHTLISGSGLDVGLPAGQMGNSEVGHMSLGAGRMVDQDFTRITRAIDDGSFRENPTLKRSLETLRDTGKALHLLGLLSPGGVHSHQDHIEAAVAMAFATGVETVYLHGFLDGRDVPPRSAQASIEKLQHHIASLGNGGIASIIGRYYAMDRDNRWDRVEVAYKLITTADTPYIFHSPMAALEAAYGRGESDEFVQASAIKLGGKRVTLADGDAVWCMNFRADRARQLTRAFVSTHFSEFERPHQAKLSAYVMLTEYAADIQAPSAFTKQPLRNSLGEYIAALGKSQLRIAETEKYAHVTFFFSGGREDPFPLEDRKLIASPRVPTYDLQPQMSAPELTDILTQMIWARKYDLIVCNYANGDMVGHTGNLPASIKAVECLDECLGKITKALADVGGHCLITADHGNVEQMRDPTTGQAHTAHTTGLVPLVYVGNAKVGLLPGGGTLIDVAPTLLTIMGLEQPPEMTGRSLVTDGVASIMQTDKAP